MENQVISNQYIKLNKLNALLQSLFGTNYSVDVSTRLLDGCVLRDLADLRSLRNGPIISILSSRVH